MRVVCTDPWLVCETGGVRVVLPPALGRNPDASHGTWLLVSDCAIDELMKEAADGVAAQRLSSSLLD